MAVSEGIVLKGEEYPLPLRIFEEEEYPWRRSRWKSNLGFPALERSSIYSKTVSETLHILWVDARQRTHNFWRPERAFNREALNLRKFMAIRC